MRRMRSTALSHMVTATFDYSEVKSQMKLACQFMSLAQGARLVIHLIQALSGRSSSRTKHWDPGSSALCRLLS